MTGEILRARRALMYVPGSDEAKIKKASALDLDSAILDLEDGVAFNQKDEARGIIRRALETLDFGRTERMVRINPLYSGRAQEDLFAVLPGKPDAILIPKADSPQIVREVDESITEMEQEHGWDRGRIALALLIESAAAFVNLAEICRSSARIQALVFGAEDYCADAGVTRTVEATELLFVRSSLVLHAAALGCKRSTWCRSITAIPRCWNGNAAPRLNWVSAAKRWFTRGRSTWCSACSRRMKN